MASPKQPDSARRDSIALPPPPRMVRPIRRRPWMIGGLLVFAIALLAAFGTPAAPHVAKPGDLSNAHAQILQGTLTQERCTSCHVNVSAQTWSKLSETGHAGESINTASIETATMTDRCLQCHHNRIAPSRARSAHNLSPEDRLHLTQRLHRSLPDGDRNAVQTVSNSSGLFAWLTGARMPSAAISQDDVACSVCHREHHGVHANLSAVTDARCQSCHTRQFGSFATSHPEFNDYPATSARTIAFDHVRHANLHFPKQFESESAGRGGLDAAAQFDCRACHIVDLGNDQDRSTDYDPIISTLPFDTACASCHDEKLKVAIASGPALISLPILPVEITRQVASWPDEATGSPDGELSGWMKVLLIAQNPKLNLDGLSHLGRVDWDSPGRQDQVVQLATAIRQFAIDLSIHGQPRLRELAIQAGASDAQAETLARSFQPQLMRDAVKTWFGKSKMERDRFSARGNPLSTATRGVTRLVGTGDDLLLGGSGNDLLSDELLTDDLLSNDPLEQGQSAPDPLAASQTSSDQVQRWQDMLAERFDPATTQTLGGWYRDDLTLSLRYRGTGHTDGVLRTLIDLARTRDPELIEQNAVAACIECHANGRWKATGITGLRDRLTKFTHRPHLDIRGLQNCQHCHEMNSPAKINVVDRVLANPLPSNRLPANSVLGDTGHSGNETEPSLGRVSPGGDFVPLQKASCAACHTSTAAGDHCTTCHRYHVGDVP